MVRQRVFIQDKQFMLKQLDGQPAVTFHGILHCRVYVPLKAAQEMRNIGFLPYRCERSQKSLIFFCKNCYLKRNQTEVCKCDRVTSSWYGMYFSDEILYSMSLGYEIDILSFFGYTRQEKILSKWMSIMAHQKLRFTDHGCEEGLEERLSFINQKSGFVSDELRLTKEKLNPNPSMKSAVKLLMNSAIGKWGQLNLKTNTTFVYSDEDLNKLFADTSIEICNVTLVTENSLMVNWKTREEKNLSSLNTNFYVSGVISSLGRIYLDRLIRLALNANQAVIYTDTDSILSLKSRSQSKIDWLYDDAILGGLKSEIPEGYYISKIDF